MAVVSANASMVRGALCRYASGSRAVGNSTARQRLFVQATYCISPNNRQLATDNQHPTAW